MSAAGWAEGLRLMLGALRLMVQRERSTSEMMQELNISRDTAERVLAALPAAGVEVETRRAGRFAYHHVTEAAARCAVGLSRPAEEKTP